MMIKTTFPYRSIPFISLLIMILVFSSLTVFAANQSNSVTTETLTVQASSENGQQTTSVQTNQESVG